MHIQKGENYWPSSFASDVYEIKNDLLRKKAKSLGSKDGLTLRYLKGEYNRWIYLQENTGNQKIIGMIRLNNSDRIPSVQASFISKNYRNKGLGQVLYLGVIHQFGGVKSSSNLGEMSLRMYKKLMNYHKVTVRDGCDRKRKLEWPENQDIPFVDGERIDNSWETFYFTVKPYKNA